MNTLPRILVSLTAASLALLVSVSASAEATAHAAPEPDVPAGRSEGGPSPFHVDAEVDPTAYVLNGYSLHVGLGYRRFRLDLGAYAIDVPEFVHGNEGFDASVNGFGVKLAYFLFAEQRGVFVGVDAGVGRLLVERQGTDLAGIQTQVSTGIHAGVRIPLPAGFYATPWIGVSYGFGTRDVRLADATYKASPVTVFPAVHLGYRFE